MARILMVSPDESLLATLRASPLLARHTLETAPGAFEALRRLRRGCAVLVSPPGSSLEEDVALLGLVRSLCPGARVVLLAATATPEAVIAALRSRVFAIFTAPFDASEIADMIARAAEAEPFRDGIEVLSARPDWITVRVDCHVLNAERLVNFFNHLRADVPDAPREELMFAFREVLLNAMEHGGGFDPGQRVEVTGIRTQRTMVFYVRDPGPGFDPDDLPHSAVSNAPDDPLGHVEKRAEAGLRPGGFGMLLARQVVDELIYSERGNEVLLIKHVA
jgi:anti-sigma regulatory factor (Ser/Thr protein kinase)